MRNSPYYPKHLPKALRSLDERKKRIEKINVADSAKRKKGLLARIFGWLK